MNWNVKLCVNFKKCKEFKDESVDSKWPLFVNTTMKTLDSSLFNIYLNYSLLQALLHIIGYLNILISNKWKKHLTGRDNILPLYSLKQ